MDRIAILRNTVQSSPWGSRTAIAELLGRPGPSPEPEAELWMGAHPKASSQVLVDGESRPLLTVIDEAPETVLGAAAARFDNRLPFLFKVIAADQALSLQAHPDAARAAAGYAREQQQGVPLVAPNRCYRDVCHKPEMFCALAPSSALAGFRPIPDIIGLLATASIPLLADDLADFQAQPTPPGLRQFFAAVLGGSDEHGSQIANQAVAAASRLAASQPSFEWVLQLERDYPGDVGVVAPLLLNLVQLEPGEAIYLAPGVPHSYLRGTGVELMANSDNVLRAGLTAKHVDVDELLGILDFRAGPTPTVPLVAVDATTGVYPCPAAEFELGAITLADGATHESRDEHGPELLLTVEGRAEIIDIATGDSTAMDRGVSVVVPAAAANYRLRGEAVIYRASVPARDG